MIFGLNLTMEDVKADPRWASKEPTLKDLADFTLEKQSNYEESAILKLNGMKQEYGDGTSTLVMIYNATGVDLNLKPQKDITYNWNGHLFKYTPDKTIMNGQWSVFLHVHTSGMAYGSKAAIVYELGNNNISALLGWDTPWDQLSYNNKVHVELGNGVWDWKNEDKAIDSAGRFEEYKPKDGDFAINAYVGDNSSPILKCTVMHQ